MSARLPDRVAPATVALLAVFLVTRGVLVPLAVGPEAYRLGGRVVGNDVNLYARYAAELTGGAAPYAEVAIEYPPGALPVLLAPVVVTAGGLPYRVGYVALMAATDAVGLAAALALGRRGRSRGGAWLWVLGIPLLGPIAYLRLDLVPAVLTLWAVERAVSGHWGWAGSWLGAGALVKLYPGLLVLPALAASLRPRVVVAAALVGAAGIGLFASVLPELLTAVLGYHLERGLQVESTWASVALVARQFGADVAVPFDFGAYQVAGPGVGPLETVAAVAAVAALLGGTVLAAVTRRRVDAATPPGGDRDAARGAAFAASAFATMALLLATGSVFSPQYVLWVLALGAAALAFRDSPVRLPAWALLGVAGLTQLVYPVTYTAMLEGDALGTAVLVGRNVAVVVVAVSAVVALLRSRPTAPPFAPPFVGGAAPTFRRGASHESMPDARAEDPRR